MALTALPCFKCLPKQVGQHHGTMHLLPQGSDAIAQVQAAYDSVQNGCLPDFPTIEWYIHTPVDPTLQDRAGHHSSALFVQWVPFDIKVRAPWFRRCFHCRACSCLDAAINHLCVDNPVMAPKTDRPCSAAGRVMGRPRRCLREALAEHRGQLCSWNI
jgi:hypothetical protein